MPKNMEKTERKTITMPSCKKCTLVYHYQFHCHFLRLILCDKHYGHVNIDKPLPVPKEGMKKSEAAK